MTTANRQIHVQPKIRQILIEDLVVQNWKTKITSRIKQLASILVKTGGQSTRPPIVEEVGRSYKLSANSEIAIAAKLAENEGLERLTVLIPVIDPLINDEDDKDLTLALVQMEALLQDSAKKKPVKVKRTKTTKPKRQAPTTDKKQKTSKTPKPTTEMKKQGEPASTKPIEDMKYRELQIELKSYRDKGRHLQCKLNVNKESLRAELKRLNASKTCWPY